jgi:acetate kinase
LGLSGRSNDMRDILSAALKGHERANIALKVFIYRIKKFIGAYIGVMNGCHAIIFTAGIGENVPFIRKKITQQLSALIDKFKIRILVIPTNEELMIARDTYRLVCR